MDVKLSYFTLPCFVSISLQCSESEHCCQNYNSREIPHFQARSDQITKMKYPGKSPEHNLTFTSQLYRFLSLGLSATLSWSELLVLSLLGDYLESQENCCEAAVPQPSVISERESWFSYFRNECNVSNFKVNSFVLKYFDLHRYLEKLEICLY